MDSHRCGIALGSNLGERLANLQAARDAILALPSVEPPVSQSPAYETAPMDCPPDSPAFLNAVIEVTVKGSSAELLTHTQNIESNHGRIRSDIRNEARVIDIDLLYFGDLIVATETLSLPHPRLAERVFVLQPMQDIRPDLILPGQSVTLRTLCSMASDPGETICLFTDSW